MTFLELQEACWEDTGYKTTTPAPLVIRRFKRWINDGHRTILSHPSLTGLRQGSLALATVSGQKIYGLPMAFERIDRIVDQSNFLPLRYRTRDWFRTVDPGETASGNPIVWTDVGFVPVLIQPTSDGIWAASSAAGDMTQVVRIIGITANGDRQAQASETLQGTMRVQLGTVLPYVTILSFMMSIAATGVVSIYDDALAGNELARIPIGATSVQYQGVRLWPTPASVCNLMIDGQFSIPKLVNDTDVPMVPESFHDAIQAYGRMKEYERAGDDRYAIARGDFESRRDMLVYSVEYPADYVPISGRLQGRGVGVSTLGSAYPAEFYIE